MTEYNKFLETRKLRSTNWDKDSPLFPYDKIKFEKFLEKEKILAYKLLESDFFNAGGADEGYVVALGILNKKNAILAVKKMMLEVQHKISEYERFNPEFVTNPPKEIDWASEYYFYHSIVCNYQNLKLGLGNLIYDPDQIDKPNQKMIEKAKLKILNPETQDSIFSSGYAVTLLLQVSKYDKDVLDFLIDLVLNIESLEKTGHSSHILLELFEGYMPKNHTTEDLHNLVRRYLNFIGEHASKCRMDILKSLGIAK